MSKGFTLKYDVISKDLLGLYFDFNTLKVRILNQHNTLEPQVRIYDLRQTSDIFAVLMLNK